MKKKKSAAVVNTTSSTVKIVDGKLILSLPDAQMPVVWQMDLSQAEAASFTVEEDKKRKLFCLVTKSGDGTTTEIAPYEDKDSAVKVLMETSKTLQSAQGQIRQHTHSANNNTAPEGNDKLGGALSASLVVLLLIIWFISASGKSLNSDGSVQSVSSLPGSAASSTNEAGVPVSADDFLNNR